MSEMNEYADEFFADTRPKKYEKIVLNKVVTATVKDVSKVRSNPENATGKDKKGDREFQKLYFTVIYELEEPIDGETTIYESYGFRFYTDKKQIWYGSTDSACGKLVDVLIKNVAALTDTPSPIELKAALLGKKVKIVSEGFGPNKSMKVMIASFL